MRLKFSKKTWTILILLFIVIGGLGSVALMLKHEPRYYRNAAIQEGQERKTLSTACLGRFTKLFGCLQDGSGEWDIKMSQAQLNSFFAEDFVRLGIAEDFAKHGISEPRIIMEDNRLRIGFRVGTGWWSTIVTYDVKLWIAPKDFNVVAVEFQGRKAGSLPLGTQSMLKEIADVAKRRNIDVTWYRHEGNPVAMVRFQADRPRPTFHLRRLDTRHGMMTIGGISLEPLPIQAIRPTGIVPAGS